MKHIDFHSHILPSLDHGSDSVETSLLQLSYAKDFGVGTVVSTSHFYPHKHTVSYFLEMRDKAYSRLLAAMGTEKTYGIDILLAAEVLLCSGIEKMEGIERLCIENTRAILIELPFSDFQEDYAYSIQQLIKMGFTVILAHADRYSPENIERLISLGAKIQLNASSLVGFFKKKKLYEWIDRGLVVGLGSDIHMRDKQAYRSFKRAVSRLGARADLIFQNSVKILNL